MPSSNTPLDAGATLPPARDLDGLICPVCYRRPGDAGDSGPRSSPARLARCPEHGTVFVEARDIADAGGDALLGTTVADRFTVLARIGSGSMGSVYRARQEAMGRDIALKIMRSDRASDPETKARFEREARATSALVSPHTVTAFDFGEAGDGSWFLAMELLDGETLGQRLKRVKRLSPEETVRIAKDALKSLAEAHALGIVHRDLKPDNLFLVRVPDAGGDRRAELCKVLDFGIAKVLRDEASVDQLETQAGTVFGTPRFMSPEQAQGNALDARSDLYSLGVILYQALAGCPPFVDSDAVVVMARHIKEEPPSFADAAPDAHVPPALERVVRRALAKRPQDRPASAEQMAADLDAALDAAASGTRRRVAGSGSASARGWRRRRGLAALVAGLVVAALAVVAVIAWRGFRAGPATRTPTPAPAVAALPAPLLPDTSGTASAPATLAPSAQPGKTADPANVAVPRRVRPGAPSTLPQRHPGDRYGRFE